MSFKALLEDPFIRFADQAGRVGACDSGKRLSARERRRLATGSNVNGNSPQVASSVTITNASSEGTNRVIKTIARDAYGFRNHGNQRLRTRCATTRRAR